MSGPPEKNIPADEILVMLCADLEADGMLSSDQRAAFGAVLARNPRLNELYESFRFTRDPLASPFDAVLTSAIPEKLLRTVRESPSPRARARSARNTWASLAWLTELLRAPAFSPAVALPALAISVAAGWLLHTATGAGADARAPLASAEAQHALEATPSGVQVDLAQGVRLTPRFTFATQDKAWCRQYTLSYPENLEAGGVACRNSAGAWQVLVETGLTAPAAPPSRGSYQFAAQSEGEKTLDSVRSQLKQGNLLGPEEEAKRIADHWKTK
jgi:surface antigen